MGAKKQLVGRNNLKNASAKPSLEDTSGRYAVFDVSGCDGLIFCGGIIEPAPAENPKNVAKLSRGAKAHGSANLPTKTTPKT